MSPREVRQLAILVGATVLFVGDLVVGNRPVVSAVGLVGVLVGGLIMLAYPGRGGKPLGRGGWPFRRGAHHK